MKFSLKKEILNICDIDYIISCKERKNAIGYMTNFQSKNYDLSNTHIILPLNIQKKLMEEVYRTFYNDTNIDELIKLYNSIYINKEKAQILYQTFNLNLNKIFTFAYKLCFIDDLLDEEFKNKLNVKLNQIEGVQFKKDKINEEKGKKNLKEKMKNKFKKKNEKLKEKLKEKIISSDVSLEEKNETGQDYCVFCRQSIDSNNFENYGKICYCTSDYLTDICKKKPEGQRKEARRFITCNHKIHFKCFNEFIITNIEEDVFKCPLCTNLSNFIICDNSFLIEKNSDLIKGIDYTDNIINMDEFYKNNPDDNLKKLITSNIMTFEKYCSKLFNKQILIKDFNQDNKLLEKALKLIIADFEEFTMHYSRTSYKQEQIDIWKNILINIRILFQYKILIYLILFRNQLKNYLR